GRRRRRGRPPRRSGRGPAVRGDPRRVRGGAASRRPPVLGAPPGQGVPPRGGAVGSGRPRPLRGRQRPPLPRRRDPALSALSSGGRLGAAAQPVGVEELAPRAVPPL